MSEPKLLRRSLVSASIGIAITFLATFSVPFETRIRLLAYGALAGFFINLSCSVLGGRCQRWLEPRGLRYARFVLAAAYFVGHGLANVRCLRGGIDAWSQEVDKGMRRYRLV